MTSRSITIESVTLTGFGPYREETRFEFPSGLAVLAAPNEAGKSTLAAAISAILFGLPATKDPNAFGLARYRNWDDPPRCLGEMVLAAGGGRYRIWRDFDTHRIRLSRWHDAGWIEEVVGEHNPAARRANAKYAQWLSSLFHHTSRELFHHTFCVVQPLPQPEKVSAELQSLLAGAGDRTSHQEALKRLAESAKELTRKTGALGLTPKDGLKPGKLEEINDRIESLAGAIERSREAMEQLRSTQEEAARLAALVEERRAKLEQARQALAAFEAWRRHADSVRESSEDVRKLRRGIDRCVELQRELDEAQGKLGLYPELSSVPAGFGEGLERLEDLAYHVAEADRLYETAREIRRQAERLEAERESVAMPAAEGESAASWLRQAMRELDDALGVWRRFVALRERLEQLQAERGERYGVFDEAAPATLAAIEGYDQRRAALEAEAERTRLALARAIEARREADEAQRRLDERFALAAVHAGDRDLLERLGEILRALEATTPRLDAVRAQLRRAQNRVWMMAGLGGVLMVTAFLFRDRWPELLGPLMATGAVTLVAPLAGWRAWPPVRRSRVEADRLKAELSELKAEWDRITSALDAQATSWSARDVAQLLEEISRYLEASELVHSLRAVAPSDEELGRLENEAARCRQELAALEAALEAPKEAFDDFSEAYREYRRLVSQQTQLADEIDRLLSSWGLEGVEAHRVESAPLAGERDHPLSAWQRVWGIVEALRPGGLDPQTDRLGRLVEVAADLCEERAALEERAAAFDRLGTEIVRLQGEWERLVAPGRGAVWEHTVRALEICDQLDAAFGGDWSRVRALVQSLGEEGRAGLSSLPLCLPSPFQEALVEAGGEIAEARRRWQEYRRRQEAAAGVRREIQATLKALETEDVEALERRVEIARARLESELRAMDELAREHPSLPRPRSDGLYDDVDERFRALNASVRELESEIEEARRRLADLAYRQAQLQGETPVNIAAAELELEALRREQRRINDELDAIALAYGELDAAAVDYYDRHLDRLAARAGEYFATVSRTPGRRLRIDPELKVEAIEPAGKVALPGQLSQGTRDQLYLSLRLAVGDLLVAGAAPPFIFDDPFLNCDEERREQIRQALATLAEARQVVLLTHDGELAAWGEPIKVYRVEREESP